MDSGQVGLDQAQYHQFLAVSVHKIACFAVRNKEWIFAAQKWAEGDELTEQEGKLPAIGLSQAMEARLQKGQGAEWNGALAEDAINTACSRISSRLGVIVK